MWRKIKSILVVVGGVFYAFSCTSGSGTLHVMTVGNSGVTMLVDGSPTLESTQDGDHYTFKVKQGQHEVKVTDTVTGTSTTYSVNIPAGVTELLLPVRADQCFVRFNMTNAGSEGGSTAPPPPVADRYQNGGQPITMPSSTYFTLEELRSKRRDKESAYVLRDVPCALLAPNIKEEVLHQALSSKADELFTNLDAIVKPPQQ